jgi:hypothetical protein
MRLLARLDAQRPVASSQRNRELSGSKQGITTLVTGNDFTFEIFDHTPELCLCALERDSLRRPSILVGLMCECVDKAADALSDSLMQRMALVAR